ncbi:hypothetical protein [Parafrankia discariae]|uniref:hypothetical protein n=1 Tax=Parafrankia discariae TaxID=365528 RepID=UPI00039D9FBB|nr:hypothetical protein [Parafrankia discariae]
MATELTGEPPLWANGATYDAKLLRHLAVSADQPLIGGAGPIVVRSGVHPGYGEPLAVTTSTGMNVYVHAGFATVQGTTTADQGAYRTGLATNGTLAIPTSNATNPRRDLVVLQVEDTGDENSRSRIRLIAGTPAPVPADPAIPASSLILARVTVGAGVTSIPATAITDLRVFTVATGGILPTLFGATVSNPYDGMARYDTDTDTLRVFDGANWQYVGAPSAPRGIIAKAYNTIGTVGWRNGPEVSQQFLSFVPFVAGRRYRMVSNLRIGSAGGANTPGDFVVLSHKIGGVRKSQYEFVTSPALQGLTPDCMTYETLVDDVTTGSQNCTLDAVNLSGTGYHQIIAGGGIRCVFYVEDLGSLV